VNSIEIHIYPHKAAPLLSSSLPLPTLPLESPM